MFCILYFIKKGTQLVFWASVATYSNWQTLKITVMLTVNVTLICFFALIGPLLEIASSGPHVNENYTKIDLPLLLIKVMFFLYIYLSYG